MATTQRDPKTGIFMAVWTNGEGKRVSLSTGEVIFERAAKRAAVLEAEARFWDDQRAGVWQRMADAKFSPRFLHSIFVGRAHLAFPIFRRLLNEAEVAFKAPGAWVDRTKPKGRKTGKTWLLDRVAHTLDELLEKADPTITRSALRFRLDAGWSVQVAIETPLLSRSEAGLRAHPNSTPAAA